MVPSNVPARASVSSSLTMNQEAMGSDTGRASGGDREQKRRRVRSGSIV